MLTGVFNRKYFVTVRQTHAKEDSSERTTLAPWHGIIMI